MSNKHWDPSWSSLWPKKASLFRNRAPFHRKINRSSRDRRFLSDSAATRIGRKNENNFWLSCLFFPRSLDSGKRQFHLDEFRSLLDNVQEASFRHCHRYFIVEDDPPPTFNGCSKIIFLHRPRLHFCCRHHLLHLKDTLKNFSSPVANLINILRA